MFILFAARSLLAYSTEKVILVFMGGVRNTEAFADPDHRFVPTIWNSIRPQGILLNNFNNTAFTGMNTGTIQALTGVRTNENQRGASYHCLSPTMYEYFRKDTGASATDVWAILSHTFNNTGINHSLHPAYGPGYAASLWADSHNNDRVTFEKAMEVMDEYHPTLLTIHFVEPDVKAQHVDNPDLPDSVAWSNYTQAITVVDSLIGLLWERIQEDPFYSGKTALFITCAHGRHLPEFGDFQWHGDACRGCRNLPFLAVGPDFRAGETSTIRADLIDLCPTIGELLSFDPVFARGRVLWELFENPLQRNGETPEGKRISPKANTEQEGLLVSTPGVDSRTPFIVAIGDTLHVIWTERDTVSLMESRSIKYSSSTDLKGAWSVPSTLFSSNPQEGEVVRVASMAGNRSGLGVLCEKYIYDLYEQKDSCWVWVVDAMTSVDGSHWSDPPVKVFKNKHFTTIDNVPASEITDSSFVAAFLGKGFNRYFGVSTNMGQTWFNIHIDPRPDNEFTTPNTPSILIRDRIYYVETLRYVPHSRVLFFSSEGSDMIFRSIVDDTNDESFFPQLGAGDSTLYCAWSDNREGHWEICFSRSSDNGLTWSPNRIISSSGVDTWELAMEASGDTIVLVWEDYRNGESQLYKKVSFDGGDHWSQDFPEVTSPGLSTSPSLSESQGHYYLAWQDYRDGYWGIYIKEIDIDLPTGIEEGSPNDAPGPRAITLSQNFPNPFNPTTSIRFTVPDTGANDVSLRIYDQRGRLVRVLFDESATPGQHIVVWDGKDGEGVPVASGIYFSILENGRKRITRKMLLLR